MTAQIHHIHGEVVHLPLVRMSAPRDYAEPDPDEELARQYEQYIGAALLGFGVGLVPFLALLAFMVLA